MSLAVAEGLPAPSPDVAAQSRAPALAASRIRELDVLRGFAVLGIFWINIVFFAYPYGAYEMPTLFGSADRLNLYTWWLGDLFVEGSMFALFSMLFGASALILLDDARLRGEQGVARVEEYYRRSLWLIAFGLLHAFVLLSPLEILFTYGVLGLALFPLRNLRPWTLLLLGLLLTAGGATGFVKSDAGSGEEVVVDQAGDASELLQFFRKLPLADRARAIAAYKQGILDEMEADIDLYRSDYANIFLANLDPAIQQQTENLYRENVFDAGGMMLIGMALLKWGVLSGGRPLALYWVMMIAGYALALLMRFPLSYDVIEYGFPPKVVMELSAQRHFYARVPLAFGHLGLVLLLCRAPLFAFLSRGLSALGRMALSNYLLQSLFSVLLFYGFGLGYFAALERYQVALVAVAFGGVQMLLSLLWLRRFRYGPFEWLWRSLVKMQRVPLRLERKPSPP